MKVRVWNDNIYDYEQKFLDREIKIPARKFIHMDYEEAHKFKQTYSSVVKDPGGLPDPRFFKMIRIDKPNEEELKKDIALTCPGCGVIQKDDEELSAHIETHQLQLKTLEQIKSLGLMKKSHSYDVDIPEIKKRMK